MTTIRLRRRRLCLDWASVGPQWPRSRRYVRRWVGLWSLPGRNHAPWIKPNSMQQSTSVLPTVIFLCHQLLMKYVIYTKFKMTSGLQFMTECYFFMCHLS